MSALFQPSGNAVLQRELRASLRNARPFALIALYVAVLGAVVVSQFPANQAITVEQGGGRLGKDLYWTFVVTQAALIFLVLPAIAAGALAQEREQRTLEPLLLTPLTPLQIVWGKAAGVLSIGGLLLLSTLPLTSLCFLLGGVSPGELVAAYAVLLGLALFTASIGLYCSAKWANAVHATLACDLLLPFFMMFLMLFSGIGVIIAALAMCGFMLHLVARAWSRWGARSVGHMSTPLAGRWGVLWTLLGWMALLTTAIFLAYAMTRDRDAGSIAFGAFAVAYLIFISQLALQQAAREIVRPPEPRTPARQKRRDLQIEWQQAMAPPAPYLPQPMLLDAQRAVQRREYEKNVRELAADFEINPALTPPARDTYGTAPFLSDKLNPIYARDLRSGLLGKFRYLLRFSYLAVIGSEVLLILLALILPAQPMAQEWLWFRSWAICHLVVLLVAGAWLGARSIAPEHEQQTLAQLITTPLTPLQIVAGKIFAVMTYTFYVFMLGLPLALLLAAVQVVTWRAAGAFLAIEIVFGALAAAWGIFCSQKAVTTRRALGISLGGLFVLAVGGFLFDSSVQSGFKLLIGHELVSPRVAAVFGALLSPLRLLADVLNPAAFVAVAPVGGASTPAAPLVSLFAVWLIALIVWGAVAVLLLFFTQRGFQRYADTI
jgi:ABC-type transport system involved in multi-copper enzyme maturation permease subunit